MKTETEIAQRNIKRLKKQRKDCCYDWELEVNTEHKQTCQRWLEYELSLGLCCDDQVFIEGCACRECCLIREKIKDLQKAIKIYEENGI